MIRADDIYQNRLSGYRTIKSYYPPWLSELYEMDELWKTEGKLLDISQGNTKMVLESFSINQFTEEDCERWESILNIGVHSDSSLDDRRKEIKARFILPKKSTYDDIKDIVLETVGCNCFILSDFQNIPVPDPDPLIEFKNWYGQFMTVALVDDTLSANDLEKVSKKVAEIIPVHIILTVSNNINDWESISDLDWQTVFNSMWRDTLINIKKGGEL